jgi:hypothetical protein
LIETLNRIEGIPHGSPDEASYFIKETRSVETTFDQRWMSAKPESVEDSGFLALQLLAVDQ